MRITKLSAAAVALGVAFQAGAGDALEGMKYSREGVLYRIDEAAPLSAKTAYRILELEADADTAAALEAAPARLSLTEKMAVKDLAALLLKEQGLAVRFTGARATEAAGAMVGPAVFSGALLGALRNLGSRAGLQTIIHRDAVEFAERKGFTLTLPPYENAAEVASRMMATGAANIRMSGNGVAFEAGADALRAVQHLARELRMGRRGVGSFLNDLAARQPAAAPVLQAPVTQMEGGKKLASAEQALARQMGINQPAARGAPGALREQPAVSPDPLLAATVSIEFKGDMIKAAEKLATDAGVGFRVISAPARPVRVSLKLRSVPLQVALEALGAQTKDKADIVYDKKQRRIDIHAR